ncbi:MAG: metallophosphoesterase [Bradymonadia bacterium]
MKRHPRRGRSGLAAALVGRSTHVIERHYDVWLPRGPAEAELTIAHLSDLHIGRVTPEARLRAAVDAVNDAEPDIVCLTGDFIAHSLRYLPRLTRSLEALSAPAFAVLGNHDHWHGPDEVSKALTSAGIRVLNNTSETIQVGGQPWQIVGLDDPVTGNHDLDAAFSDVSGEDGPILVLSHLAEMATEVSTRGAALVLSGHTHGGQVHVAGLTHRIMTRMGHDYILGWYDAGPTGVYVNRGIGAAVFPFRSRRAQAEVACICVRGRASEMQVSQVSGAGSPQPLRP